MRRECIVVGGKKREKKTPNRCQTGFADLINAASQIPMIEKFEALQAYSVKPYGSACMLPKGYGMIWD
jgi:hypothetical protein